MNVLQSILGDDASDAGFDDQEKFHSNEEIEIASIPRLPEVAETGLEIVAETEATVPNDCDLNPEEVNDIDADENSNLSREVDPISSTLAAAMRYFAVRLDSAEDIGSKVLDSDDSSVVVPQEIKKIICDALRLSDVTLLVASNILQCFIGYATVLRTENSIDGVVDEEKAKLLVGGLHINWEKLCCLPFKDTTKIRNSLSGDETVSEFENGQEIDATAAGDVIFFINDQNTEAESIDSLRRILGEAAVDCEAKETEDQEDVQDEANVISDQIVESENAETATSNVKKTIERKEDNTAGKRPRTDSVVSSSSTQGSEKNKKGAAKRANAAANASKRPRPKNMFDITAMNYEQYVDRHYALKYEQWFQENNSAMNAAPSIPGMAPGPGGMQIPLALAMANMAMAGGGYYGGPGPGAYGPMGGPMMMGGPPLGMGLGMGMPPGGQINPMLMHDVGMFQGMGLHNDNNSIANHIYGERSRGGHSGGTNGRVPRF